jgi:DNA-binding transcriptional MerR regulator
MERFSTTDVAKWTGASLRQLRHWQKQKLVVPSGKATGWRSYMFSDVVAIRTVVALREQGCPLQTIRKAVAHLQKHFPTKNVLTSMVLLSDGEKVYLRSDLDKVSEVMTGQYAMWLVQVGRIIEETREEAKKMPSQWTEPVKVGGKEYHLEIVRDPEVGGFNVQCRELPGAVEQGETVEEAIGNGKDAIESAVAFIARRDAIKSGTRRRA